MTPYITGFLNVARGFLGLLILGGKVREPYVCSPFLARRSFRMLLRRQPLAHEVLEPKLPVPSVRIINTMRIIHVSIVVLKGVVIIKFSGPGEILRLRILNLILVANLRFACLALGTYWAFRGAFYKGGGNKPFLAKKDPLKSLFAIETSRLLLLLFILYSHSTKTLFTRGLKS